MSVSTRVCRGVFFRLEQPPTYAAASVSDQGNGYEAVSHAELAHEERDK